MSKKMSTDPISPLRPGRIPRTNRVPGWLIPLILFVVLALVGMILAPRIQAEEPVTGIDSGEVDANCSLLDNPAARPIMSGMFETRLLLACGRAHELGGVLNNTNNRAPLLGTDVLVNNPFTDTGASRTQSETSIAINETTGTICSGYNDSYHGVTQAQGYTGFSSSTNGGASFVDHGALSSSSFGDPSVIWRRSDGKFYIFALHSTGLGLWRSDDDCSTFTYVTNPHSGSGDDKELAAVDNNPASSNYGRIYMAWTDFNVGGRIRTTYSDNTTTWSSALSVSAVGASVQGAWPAVAPNGDVYVSWVRWNPYPSGPIDIEVVRSTNGGSSFSFVTDATNGRINPRQLAATSSCGRPALNGFIRYLPSPQIAVSANGDLHVVYSTDPDGFNTGDVINVYYRRSTNSGTSWGTEVQLNDDGTLTDQFFPTISTGPGGRIISTWYDRRLDTANNFQFDYYMRESNDGGVTWQPSLRVSDVSSPVILDPNLAICYHGDYDQQVQHGGIAHIQWSDDRTVQLADPNVWFDQQAGGPPPTNTPTATATGTSTATSTATTVPTATATGTSTPTTAPTGTPTNTAVPPTATATSTPGATGVEMSSFDSNDSAPWNLLLWLLPVLFITVLLGFRHKRRSRST